MITIVNVGKKKTGKTTLTKGILNSFPGDKFIYDINNEYKEYGSSAVFPKWQTFLEQAVKKKKTCIVFEEAFIFLKHQSSTEEISELLVRNRHTENLIILNFHAIRQVPLFIWEFVNYLNLKKTNDKQKWMETNYRDTDILAAYNSVKASENPFELVTLNIDKNGV